MNVRIVVADESKARFYDTSRSDGALREAGSLENPGARLHDRDLASDRPGRSFSSARAGSGAVTHHAFGGTDGPRKHEAGLFAKRIVHELERELRDERFERVVLIAGPAFLGLLRDALPEGLRSRVVAEVVKDLAHQDVDAVQAHVPREAFRHET
jgi:protein required for attachment to host cells